MASNTVILDSSPERPAEPKAPAPIESVRPKAFRRPPGWIAPESSPHAAPAPSPRRNVPALKAAEGSAPPAHERAYGIILILLVIGVNLLAGFLLSAWNSHIKPRYHLPETAQGGPFFSQTAKPGTDAVTLYASPLDERRTLRIERLDMPLDATDAIELPPANPADDQ